MAIHHSLVHGLIATSVLRFAAFRSFYVTMAPESKTSASNVIPLLENLTVGDLEKVIAAAEQQRESRRESGKRELVEEFKAKAEALGLSLDELLAGSVEASRPAGKTRQSQRNTPTARPAAKYRDPETGVTWSGRGRMPKWLALAEQQGHSRDEFTASS